MKQKCSYKLRLGHGSKELLIEFEISQNPKKFMEDLSLLLVENGFSYTGTEDLWMNDEVLFWYSSKHGKIEVSIDIYNIVFIMSNDQSAILKVDFLLCNSELFEKENLPNSSGLTF